METEIINGKEYAKVKDFDGVFDNCDFCSLNHTKDCNFDRDCDETHYELLKEEEDGSED